VDPGSITLVTVLANRMEWYHITAIILVAVGICALTLMFAERIYDAMGEEGDKVITRIMGLLTFAIAVQYILDGLSYLIASL